MAKKRFVMQPGGKLVRSRNRFGGECADKSCDACGRCNWRHCEGRVNSRRRDAARRTLDLELRQARTALFGSHDTGVWTVMEPCSRRFREQVLIVEAPRELALRVYAARTGGRHPEKVSCDCGCGADYSISEFTGSLAAATAELRHCEFVEDYSGDPLPIERAPLSGPGRWYYQTLEQFLAREDVTVIRADEITDAERETPLPALTGPANYSQDELALAWLFGAEL